jgi:hypothetical protein
VNKVNVVSTVTRLWEYTTEGPYFDSLQTQEICVWPWNPTNRLMYGCAVTFQG